MISVVSPPKVVSLSDDSVGSIQILFLSVYLLLCVGLLSGAVFVVSSAGMVIICIEHVMRHT